MAIAAHMTRRRFASSPSNVTTTHHLPSLFTLHSSFVSHHSRTSSTRFVFFTPHSTPVGPTADAHARRQTVGASALPASNTPFLGFVRCYARGYYFSTAALREDRVGVRNTSPTRVVIVVDGDGHCVIWEYINLLGVRSQLYFNYFIFKKISNF